MKNSTNYFFVRAVLVQPLTHYFLDFLDELGLFVFGLHCVRGGALSCIFFFTILKFALFVQQNKIISTTGTNETTKVLSLSLFLSVPFTLLMVVTRGGK